MLTSILRTQNAFVEMRKRLPYFQVEEVLSVSWQSLTKSTGWENLGSIYLAQPYTEAPFNMTLSLVQFSHSVVSDSLWPHELQHTRPPCPSPTPRVHPNPRPLCQWCHPTISSSVVPFSSCPQSFPASGTFQMSQLFTSDGQSIGVSASASVPPVTLLLLLLSHFSRVQLCETPKMAAHQAPPSLGFSRQEHWSGLPFPSPMHESEKWKWSRSDTSK